MKTLVSTFVTNEVIVRFSNIIIDPSKKRGTMLLGTKPQDKRVKKFTEQQIDFTITNELYNYLTLLRPDKIQVAANNEAGYEWIPTGTKSTSFQKYLAKRGVTFKTGILSELVFECDNTSTDYTSNPFRLVTFNNGNAVLTMVNMAPKNKVEKIDPTTGEVSTFYSNKTFTDKNGKLRKAFVAPSYYRRLVQETIVEVELYQDQNQN